MKDNREITNKYIYRPQKILFKRGKSPNIHNRNTPKTEKIWGAEFSIISEEYTVKMMTLEPQTVCSMHFHREKKETFVLISGQIYIDIVELHIGKQTTLHLQNVGDSVTLEPDVPHSFYCPDNQIGPTVFIECSTKDSFSDNFRFFPSRRKDSNSR